MNLPYLLNTAWMWRCRGQYRAFETSTGHVAKTQWQLLRTMLRANRNCEFGRKYRFAKLHSVDEFRREVPVSDQDDFSRWITDIGNGRTRVLTSEPVRLLEPTSGSTSGRRLIPFTRTLQRQFHRAVASWIADLFSARPAVRSGRAYWSVSPSFPGQEFSPGGLKIGFEEDAAYLGKLDQLVARCVMAVPSKMIKNVAADDFRYLTLLHLLEAVDLALISAWSPTFITALFRPLQQWSDRLSRDLRQRQHTSRAEQVRSVFNSNSPIPDKLTELWPNLALISCWADATAAEYIHDVRALFPRVEIQPKGLLSTEACVSLPLVGRPGSALALRSHFFEFQPELSRPETRLAHQLDVGRRYHVIVTTGGGLYRYPTHDLIEVMGFENQCPLIRFVGRDKTSDLVGEKLTEMFARTAIERVLQPLPRRPSFAMVVPLRTDPPKYCLLLQFEEPCVAENFPGGLGGGPPMASSTRIARELSQHLCLNPYYQHAVQLGQLSPACVRIVSPQQVRLWDVYEQQSVELGIRAGDVKPTSLELRLNWTKLLEGMAAAF